MGGRCLEPQGSLCPPLPSPGARGSAEGHQGGPRAKHPGIAAAQQLASRSLRGARLADGSPSLRAGSSSPPRGAAGEGHFQPCGLRCKRGGRSPALRASRSPRPLRSFRSAGSTCARARGPQPRLPAAPRSAQVAPPPPPQLLKRAERGRRRQGPGPSLISLGQRTALLCWAAWSQSVGSETRKQVFASPGSYPTHQLRQSLRGWQVERQNSRNSAITQQCSKLRFTMRQAVDAKRSHVSASHARCNAQLPRIATSLKAITMASNSGLSIDFLECFLGGAIIHSNPNLLSRQMPGVCLKSQPL